MAGIFKAYDIRGIYGKDLTDDTAYKIGRAFVSFLGCKKVVVGNDMRPHSTNILEALTKGITDQGADAVTLGLCSTPMSYFANGMLEADASIMITASHNPAEWNGFKLCRAQAVPISGETGIADIERLVQTASFTPSSTKGSISSFDIAEAYAKHVTKQAELKRPVRIAADFANAMGVYEAEALKKIMQVTPIFENLDGSFPNHEANPLKLETFKALCEKVRSGQYDFGVAFDGDADRAGFVDETGEIIPMDMITALIAKSMLQHEKGVVLYDLRSSWTVREVIEENGGTPLMCRVGHAFIKQQMREQNAAFAGELSGHYYFRDNYFTESAAMAVIYLANIISRDETPLSTLIKPFKRYAKSSEINSEVKDVDSVFKRLKENYAAGKMIELDGLSVEFDDWWFNVRSSNTEPLVRLNLEARNEKLLEKRVAEVLEIIRS